MTMGEDPGPGRDRRERGYFIASPRTWARIRLGVEGGASVAWLSARYGPAERTIASRAKKEGWRKKDLALLADDAPEEAVSYAGGLDTVDAAAAMAATTGYDGAGGAGWSEGGGIDLERAMRLAQAKALKALEVGDARTAQDFLKLARMLAGDMDGGGQEDADGTERGQQAALEFLRQAALRD